MDRVYGEIKTHFSDKLQHVYNCFLQEMSTYRISALQGVLQDSVPLTVLEATNKQFDELTSKYRDLLQKEQSLVRCI
jgi:hypothetical protein